MAKKKNTNPQTRESKERDAFYKESKFLSKLLRHQGRNMGFEVSDEGWVEINAIAKHTKHMEGMSTLNLMNIKKLMNGATKERFVLSEDETRIRAAQGHSMDVDLGLEPVEPPAFLYHGTSRRSMDAIWDTGINKRDRQHVHLSADLATAENVGSRHGSPVIFTLDAQRMHADGVEFFQAENGVWLTEFVDPQYLSMENAW